MRRFPFAAVLVLVFACSVSAQQVEFTDRVELDIAYRAPVRLLPGGKQVLHVARDEDHKGEDRRYAYYVADIDGKNKRKLYASTLDWDDLFNFSTGAGFVSPSGKKMTGHHALCRRERSRGRP